MILTGTEIQREWEAGRITIDPFTPEQVNPNSYNFRLGATLHVYSSFPLDPREANEFVQIEIPEDGYVLEPGRLYLAHTLEVLGSNHYAPTFAARSSVARLGMFINLSASLGDIGYEGQWTLQLYVLHKVRVYPEINIGQMMWWVPQGDVELYRGKYQGAKGPRSSDIHIDFDKQAARQRLPSLGASNAMDVNRVGPKFAALSRSSKDFSVPPAFCVPAMEFADALTTDQGAELADAFADIRATVGAFYTESVERIAGIARAVRLPDEARALVELRLRDMFGPAKSNFAVRSSGLEEDGANNSLAGVHQSLLDVPLDEVITAVERCWAAYYEAPAVAARVRVGNFSADPKLAVIVQKMVSPTIAGVSFSGLHRRESDEIVVEFVDGLADALVAGVADPIKVTSDAVSAAGESNAQTLEAVIALTRALRDQWKHDVDVEWAADSEGVKLIQVRPLTARIDRPNSNNAPVGAACSLYIDDPPSDFYLGEVASVYGGYVAKRGPTYRLAKSYDIETGRGWLIQFNGHGLNDPRTRSTLGAILDGGTSNECVLDLSDTLRQIVVSKTEVLDRLAELTGAESDESAIHAAIVRDFVRGDCGVISRMAGECLSVEYASEGLMALNRGTAGGSTIVVSDLVNPSVDTQAEDVDGGAAALEPHLRGIVQFTSAITDAHGPATLEWVQADAELYFVDYSVLGAEDSVVSAADAQQISPGTARGPLLHLPDDELLARLSIGPAVSVDRTTDVEQYDGLARIVDRVKASPRPPIVHAHRPYAVLSVLIGHVAGFVFDQGSTLGHLAILLREAGVPAVAASDISHSGEVIISNGTLTVADTAEAR